MEPYTLTYQEFVSNFSKKYPGPNLFKRAGTAWQYYKENEEEFRNLRITQRGGSTKDKKMLFTLLVIFQKQMIEYEDVEFDGHIICSRIKLGQSLAKIPDYLKNKCKYSPNTKNYESADYYLDKIEWDKTIDILNLIQEYSSKFKGIFYYTLAQSFKILVSTVIMIVKISNMPLQHICDKNNTFNRLYPLLMNIFNKSPIWTMFLPITLGGGVFKKGSQFEYKTLFPASGYEGSYDRECKYRETHSMSINNKYIKNFELDKDTELYIYRSLQKLPLIRKEIDKIENDITYTTGQNQLARPLLRIPPTPTPWRYAR